MEPYQERPKGRKTLTENPQLGELRTNPPSMDNMKKKKVKPSTGSVTSKRHGGGIVPVPAGSSTRDGLLEGLPARPSGEVTSARVETEKDRQKEKERVKWSMRRRRMVNPPSEWFPAILPKYEDINTSSKEEYLAWAWKWEADVNQVEKLMHKCIMERSDEEWVEREVDWIGYAEEMEEIADEHSKLRKSYQILWDRDQKRSKEQAAREVLNTGTQTDVEVRSGVVDEVMEVDAPAGQNRIEAIEANLEKVVQAVSTLGKSLDSLGGRCARELGEIRELVRNMRPANVSPPSGESVVAPPLSYARACGDTPKGARAAGDGVGVRKRKRKPELGVDASAPPISGRRNAVPAPPAPVAVHPPVSRGHPAAGMGVARVSAPSPPQTAAVLVRAKEGEEGFDYVDALRRVKAQVPLPEGAAGTSVRRSANGGLLVEVCGPRSGETADVLVERLSSLLPEASVRRAERSGEVRLVGFDEAVLPAELARALAGCANCEASKVRMGVPRWGPRGIGVAWARLPLAAALSAARVGQFAMGWSTVRVEYLESRPLQCHRCWGYGHMRAQCPSTNTDRSRTCYRCGLGGIKRAIAAKCQPARCVPVPGSQPDTGWGAKPAGSPVGPGRAVQAALDAGGGGLQHARAHVGELSVPSHGLPVGGIPECGEPPSPRVSPASSGGREAASSLRVPPPEGFGLSGSLPGTDPLSGT